MAAFSSLIGAIIWLSIILSIVNKITGKNRRNSWSRTPSSRAEQQAARIREEAGKSNPQTAASSNPAFRMPSAVSKGASRANFVHNVDDYSSTNVSGLDKGLERDRGGRSLRDLASFFGEDRRNDWMARQMREEARIKRMSGTLDLGAAHDADCDAADLKAEHRRVHSDAIDSGEPGRILRMQQKKRGY
jgi:hypothetical protein